MGRRLAAGERRLGRFLNCQVWARLSFWLERRLLSPAVFSFSDNLWLVLGLVQSEPDCSSPSYLPAAVYLETSREGRPQAQV